MHALGPDEISEMLNLDSISESRDWMIVACSAKTKEGLEDGFNWVIESMKSSKKAQ